MRWVERVWHRGTDSRASIEHLGALTTDAAGKLDVLGHDGHTLGVDGAQVGVFEQTNKVGLGSFLQSKDSGSLESQVGFEILGDLTDEALEWKLADQEFRGLLVSADLTQSNGTGAVSVGLLDAAGGWCGLACCLGGELLAGRFASGGFTCGLLGTGHFERLKVEGTLKKNVNEFKIFSCAL